jgi:chromosome segregation ATPase
MPIHIPDKPKEVRVSESSRKDARGGARNGNSLKEAMAELTRRREVLKGEYFNIEKRLSKLKSLTAMTRDEWAAVGKERSELVERKMALVEELRETSKQQRSIHHDLNLCDVEHPNGENKTLWKIFEELRDLKKQIGEVREMVGKIGEKL